MRNATSNKENTCHNKRYWIALALSIIGSFAVLGGVGRQMISKLRACPMSIRRMGNFYLREFEYRRAGRVAVHRRARDWHSVGTRRIRGFPDWSADWLHRESTSLLDTWATRAGARFAALGVDHRPSQCAADSRDANEYL